MANFVIVVDGEVAGNIPIPERLNAGSEIEHRMAGLIAALSSDPKIILHNYVPIGSTWDGETFTEPQ